MIELHINQDIKDKHRQFIFGEENVGKIGRINKKLQTAYTDEIVAEGRKVYKFVIDRFEEIVIGEIHELFKIKNEYIQVFSKVPNVKDKSRIHDKLKQMFEAEYKNFYSDPVFNAYQFQRLLNINVCPYCGTQFIFLYEGEDGKSRGTLDHFIDKAKYPIFAVSIYNLIPCCKVCNSDFKKSITMDLENYFTPYEKGIVDYIKFCKVLTSNDSDNFLPEIVKRLDIKEKKEIDYVSAILGVNDEFSIDIDCSAAPEYISKRIMGNINLFKVKELYNLYHKNFIRDQIRKAYVYNYVYRKQLMYNFSDLFITEEEIKALIIPKVEDDNKYILNKLIRDIVLVETESFSI